MERLKVLFHIDEPEKWSLALANIASLIRDAGGENLEVVVVVNGTAVIRFISHDTVEAQVTEHKMSELSALGVTFTACGNSLKGLSLDEKELPPYVGIVPAGITELIRKQSEGYAYVKP